MGLRWRGSWLGGLWSRWRLFNARSEASEGLSGGVARPPQVPGYDTEELLGLGGTGEVWAAREVPSGRPVALKRLRVATDIAAREGLRREGELLAAFQHPHVIVFHGLRHDGEGLVLVLERAATSLSAVVSSRGPLGPAEAVGVVAPIAAALAEAHVLGLVHGDVSPANVLLRANGHPLLADLGTAKILAACDPAGSLAPAGSFTTSGPLGAAGPFGTAGFADQAARLGVGVTSASDVYSLAAVLAYALSGRPLGARPGAPQRWAEAAHSAQIPAALVTVVCEALTSEPERRVTAADFAGRLRVAVSPSRLRFGVDAREPVGYDTAGEPSKATALEIPNVFGAPNTFDRPNVVGTLRGLEPRGGSKARGVSGTSNIFRPSVVFETPGVPAIPVTSRSDQEAASAGDVESPLERGLLIRRRWFATRRGRRIIFAVPLVVVLAVGLTVVGPRAWAAFGGDPGANRVAEADARQRTAAREWTAIMSGLDAARGFAFATADIDKLRNVYEPDSPMHHNDRRQLEALRNIGLVVVGIHHYFSEVRLLEQGGTTATIRLAERLEPYSVVRVGTGQRGNSAPEPEVIRAIGAGTKREVTVQLHKTDGRWRIVALTPDR